MVITREEYENQMNNESSYNDSLLKQYEDKQEQEIPQANVAETTNNDNRSREEILAEYKKEAILQAEYENEYNKVKNELIRNNDETEKNVRVISYRSQNIPETQQYRQPYSENIESYDNGQNALNKVNEVLGNNVPRQGISTMFVQRTQNNNNFFWDNNTKNIKLKNKSVGNFDKWLGSKKSTNPLQGMFSNKSTKNVLPNTNFNNFNKMFGTNKSKSKSKSLFNPNKKLNQMLGKNKKFKF